MKRISIVILLLLTMACHAQRWTWSKPALHHWSVVEITSHGDCTSGVQIDYGGMKGILTVMHGLNKQTATVTFADGKTMTGRHTIDHLKNDIGFIDVYNPNIPCVKLASVRPRKGDVLEVVSYGGPANKRMRHFHTTVKGHMIKDIHMNESVVPGDSGSPVFNSRRELVTVISHGTGRTLKTYPWPIYDDSKGPSEYEVGKFLGRLFNRRRRNLQNCPGGVCPTPGNGSNGSGSYEEYYPPESELPPLPSLPFDPNNTIPPPPEKLQPVIDEKIITQIIEEKLANLKPKVNIDYQLLASMVITEIKNDPSLQIAGKDGRDGVDGKDGINGKDGTSANIDLNALKHEIINSLPPIKVTYEGGETVELRPGDAITIPSVKMEIYTPEGKVLRQSKPLGEAIKIDLILEDKK